MSEERGLYRRDSGGYVALSPSGLTVFELTQTRTPLTTWIIELNPSITLLQLRSYVNAQFMIGLAYTSTAARVAARVLFAAATHPQFRYAEVMEQPPRWWQFLTENG